MKTYRGLWGRLCSFENLLVAAQKACTGKRNRPDVAAFHFRLEPNLFALRRELLSGEYVPGPYRQFVVREKKERLISAAPYRDRVVHHALCAVIEPLWERRFIDDSYACRAGKGTHAACRRAAGFLKSREWVLKMDIRSYFPSIDHEILLSLIQRRVRDAAVMDLVRKVIDTSPPQVEANFYFCGDSLFTPYERRRGLPIGNQTSQFFANVYLDPLDHYVKEELRCRAYVRYVDDLLLMSDDKAALQEMRVRVENYLARLRLTVHPRKCQVFPARQGVAFLGYRIFPTHTILAKENARRFRRRLRRLAEQFERGEVLMESVRASVHGWIGHAAHADSYRLRSAILSSIAFKGPAQTARSARGLVEEQQPQQPALCESEQEQP